MLTVEGNTPLGRVLLRSGVKLVAYRVPQFPFWNLQKWQLQGKKKQLWKGKSCARNRPNPLRSSPLLRCTYSWSSRSCLVSRKAAAKLWYLTTRTALSSPKGSKGGRWAVEILVREPPRPLELSWATPRSVWDSPITPKVGSRNQIRAQAIRQLRRRCLLLTRRSRKASQS